MTAYQYQGEEEHCDEDVLDVSIEYLLHLLLLLGVPVLVEVDHLIDEGASLHVEEDGAQHGQEEGAEYYKQVEAKEVHWFPEVEGQQGKYEEGQGDDQEGVLEDGGSECDKQEDVSSKHAQAREEDEEVEDKEHGEYALVALLGVYLEHSFHGVDLRL